MFIDEREDLRNRSRELDFRIEDSRKKITYRNYKIAKNVFSKNEFPFFKKNLDHDHIENNYYHCNN